MTPWQWSETDRILKDALELPESEQDGWIARECEGPARAEEEKRTKSNRCSAPTGTRKPFWNRTPTRTRGGESAPTC